MHEIDVETDLLANNNAVAQHNRDHFAASHTYVINMMSSPGAGKTTLLERTIDALVGKYKLGVIEGDVQTDLDARRIGKHHVPVVQINTGGACHLDARLVHRELDRFDTSQLDLLIIENVGNLVCPAEFDLGEHDKIMLLSVAEGDDKPRKYPVMFHSSRALIINKIDLLEHTNFDMDKAERDARAYNLDLSVFRLSARTGAGMDGWLAWLESRIALTKAHGG